MSCPACEKTKLDRARDVIKAIVKHPSNIIKGNYNLVVKDSKIEDYAKQRLLKCYECSDKVLIAKILNKECWLCAYCSCPIETKARSLNEQCKLNKW